MTIRPEQMPYAIGWRKAPPDPRTLQLARYTTGQLPPPPVSVDWLGKVRSWPMLLNDEIGDCAPAAACHLAEAWTTYAGIAYTPTDEDVLAAYEGAGGYDPHREAADGSNPTDQGCTSLGVLGWWRRAGVGGHKITAYAQVNVTDHKQVQSALNLFGGLFVAVDMPLSAGQQTRKRQTWRPAAGAAGKPGSWGGHAIHVGGYGPRTLSAITWGSVQRMSWAFWDDYVAEAYACLAPEWINTASGTSPTGLDLAALLTDLAAIH